MTRTRTVSRASEPAQRQRDGTTFTGAFGQRTGESDLLFVEGQLPERDETVAGDESASTQLALCLKNLESVLETNGRSGDDILKLTLYLADMDAYERVNETYEQHFEGSHPARTTVGVCDLLGGASVTVDAVVAIE